MNTVAINNTTSQPQAPAMPRFDVYVDIHKALRRFMCDTLTKVASLDGDDQQEVAETLTQLREMTAFCAGHVRNENNYVHPAMEARRPGSTSLAAAEHEHHASAFDELHRLADAVELSNGFGREKAAAHLHHYLTVFIAENFIHMNIEESENNAVLWATHTDEELHGIEQAIVASIPPDEMALCMRWMIPAMSAAERARKFAGIRHGAPAPVFEAIMGIAKANLTAGDWDKLTQALAEPMPLAA